MQADCEPLILAVGGGKGGTGKSTVAISIAAQIAASGRNVILADLDFGAANLHTLLKIENIGKSLVQFLYQPGIVKNLDECLNSTEIAGLYLLPGDGFVPGIANMEFVKKQKLIRSLKKLHSDYVVCDLGAGSSFNVVDFFLSAHYGILVLTAEPTAILNAYEFVKNCVFRKIGRSFSKDREISKLVNSYKKRWKNSSGGSVVEMIAEIKTVYPEAAGLMQELSSKFAPAMLLNKETLKDSSIGVKLNELSMKYLNARIEYLGALPLEARIRGGIIPMVMSSASSPFKEKLIELAEFYEKKNNIKNQPKNS